MVCYGIVGDYHTKNYSKTLVGAYHIQTMVLLQETTVNCSIPWYVMVML